MPHPQDKFFGVDKVWWSQAKIILREQRPQLFYHPGLTLAQWTLLFSKSLFLEETFARLSRWEVKVSERCFYWSRQGLGSSGKLMTTILKPGFYLLFAPIAPRNHEYIYHLKNKKDILGASQYICQNLSAPINLVANFWLTKMLLGQSVRDGESFSHLSMFDQVNNTNETGFFSVRLSSKPSLSAEVLKLLPYQLALALINKERSYWRPTHYVDGHHDQAILSYQAILLDDFMVLPELVQDDIRHSDSLKSTKKSKRDVTSHLFNIKHKKNYNPTV